MSDLPPEDAERLYARVRSDLGRERSAPGWLRARSAAQRVVLFGLASLALSVAVTWALAGPARFFARDLPGWLALVGLALAGLVAIGVTVRPLWRPDWSDGSRRLLAVGVGLASFASITMSGDGTLGVLGSGRCALVGFAVGAPLFALSLLLDRQPRRVGGFRALAAGLAGAFAVQLVCPTGGLAHLVVEHFGVALAATAVFAGVGWGLSAAASRRS